ncbi:MAG: N-acetylmuramic acid 6-phosphate etherase [Candidatus Caenarcaniphilales bacterium]|nr:N-acetylmuramic acid 6-phosphate etherase [Candidatus Caenarcaniphilales bacterium]
MQNISVTETVNKESENLDKLASDALVELFADDTLNVIIALKNSKTEIARVIDSVTECLDKGGSLYYLGAGTSGRLGILDAVECPPTFSTDPEMVQGIIAGGEKAIIHAVEGAEDDEEAGYKVIKDKLTSKDALLVISASGGAAYCIGALKAAQEIGCFRGAISNNSSAKIFLHSQNNVFLNTGAELLSGSTRLKAGTSQKIVLNIISTSVMVKLGKTYGNLMIDVKVSNEKLYKRAVSLVQKIAECSEEEAKLALEKANNKVKQAILYIKKGLEFEQATKILEENRGFLSQLI